MGGRSEALRVIVKSLRLERAAEHPQCGTMTAHLAPPTSRYDIKGYEMRFKESISSSLACPVRLPHAFHANKVNQPDEESKINQWGQDQLHSSRAKKKKK